MEIFDFNNLYILIKMSIIFTFIVAMSIIALAFYVFKKTFECRDETNFGLQNRLIGKIWHKKKPKENNNEATQ